MKRLLIIPAIMIISTHCKAHVEKYYIGNIEISGEDYHALDTSMLRAKEVWTACDTTCYIVEPDVYSRIDSLSVPGKVVK